MPYKDINKRREAQKRYYYKNTEKYKEKNFNRKRMLLAFINELKRKPCKDCRIQYPSYVMDFDHSDGIEKFNNIARMVRDGLSKERILEEIEKCELVCANCHRERTFQRANSYIKTEIE